MRPDDAVTDSVKDDVTIGLDGIFDGPAARRLEAVLARAEPGTRFRIDLAKVREFQDFGIGVLAQAITRCRARVALRGVCNHQIRMLRYFGVDEATLGAAVLPDPA
jgi:anti-anti-sigma regulatory factor